MLERRLHQASSEARTLATKAPQAAPTRPPQRKPMMTVPTNTTSTVVPSSGAAGPGSIIQRNPRAVSLDGAGIMACGSRTLPPAHHPHAARGRQ
jgi:hypothetical protein